MSVVTAGAPRGTLRYQLESGLERMTPVERAARGKEARAAVLPAEILTGPRWPAVSRQRQ
jgi:hypothetical protein